MTTDDSFLSAMTRGRKKQSNVLDTITQLGVGRQTAIPQAPMGNTRLDTDVQGLGIDTGVGEGGAVNPSNPANPNAAIAGSQGLSEVNTPLPTNINVAPWGLNPVLSDVGDIVNDNTFYSKTGRWPTEQDNVLLGARRRFMAVNGRLPTPDELIYEAQRGLVGQQSDPNAPRLD